MISLDTLDISNNNGISNWADIEVEDNPYENDDNAFVPESSRIKGGGTPSKKLASKAKTSTSTTSSTTATPSKAQATTSTPSKKKKPSPTPSLSPAKALSQGHGSETTTTTTTITKSTKSIEQSPAKQTPSSKAAAKKSLKKREVVFKEITIFDTEVDQVVVEQQKQELIMFFGMFGVVESTDTRWADRSCSVVYQSAADAANAIKEFKSVSRLEDHLSTLAAKKQDLFINLKNVWNIKAAINEDSKPQPPKPSKAHPPSYQPPAHPRPHLFSQHPRSPKGEWRPVGVARSQQQQPQAQQNP
ncbi:hypothetical protein SAMD00019534_033660 [Acytostelium subglobosum LB1]|uniref:hypothetical protein n=1 Tax=Acytostelium subglobosum LB1 TaxID=1410327 RepID=UPI00064501E7|nr:hypothetical protein SAMD00019534_033660 [Acytostelium subglobosum LB1]GAM20191.1 hypothetical protein SAMD00019534_033660 [Acytostelium subglobosum LB1]|eukprot:XP_012759712.1 hypothetical protein SAMD00019534_033660 [Acytostelium subglobosum LB1]